MTEVEIHRISRQHRTHQPRYRVQGPSLVQQKMKVITHQTVGDKLNIIDGILLWFVGWLRYKVTAQE